MVSVSVSELELHAFRHQLILELEEVFHDAVLDDDHALGLPEMRVRVAGDGRAVRRPARMTDARRALDGRLGPGRPTGTTCRRPCGLRAGRRE